MKSLIYSDIPNLPLFSSEYFRQVISQMSFSEPYYVFYGDVDKLNDYNHTHGFQEGTKALHALVKKISQKFPNDTILSRLGGDEFAFIVSQSMMHFNEHDIIYDIEQKSFKFHTDALSMSVGVAVGNSTKDFNSALLKAESQAKLNKRKKQEPLIRNDWGAFSEIVKKQLTTYFDAFRFSSSYKLTDTEFIKRLDYVLENTTLLFHEPDLESSEDTAKPQNHFIKPVLSGEKLRTFHDYITTNNPNLLAKLSLSDIQVLYNTLSRSHITGLYNKSYFQNILLPELKSSETPINLLAYSLTGIKRCNDVFGHDVTDKYMMTLSSLVEERNPNTDSINIDLRGGNFLMILPIDSKLDNITLSKLFNFPKPQGIDLVYATACEVSPKDITKELEELDIECTHKKDSIKEVAVYSDKTSQILLESLLSQVCTTYLQSFSNPLDYNNKRKFFNMVFMETHNINTQYRKKDENTR